MKRKKTDYDQAMEKLEQTVRRIQDGEMGLEEMREEVKAALELIAACKTKLRDIEHDLEEILSDEEE